MSYVDLEFVPYDDDNENGNSEKYYTCVYSENDTIFAGKNIRVGGEHTISIEIEDREAGPVLVMLTVEDALSFAKSIIDIANELNKGGNK